MELKIEREWLLRKAEEEGNEIVSVGGLVAEMAAREQNASAIERSALAQLVEWQRRKLRLPIEALASRADVDLEEILAIERGEGLLDAETMYKVADVLGLPAPKLMELAGLVTERDPGLGDAAMRFAACSAPVEKLSAEESIALEEFVRALGQ